MDFQEWWRTQEEPENLLSVSVKDYAKEAWDYQQAKIDELRAEIQKAQEYSSKLEEQRWNKLFNDKG